MKRYAKSLSLYTIILVLILLVIIALSTSVSPTDKEEYNYGKLISQLEKNEISRLDIQRDADVNEAATVTVYFKDKSKAEETVTVLTLTSFMKEYVEPARAAFGLEVNTLAPPRTNWILSSLSFIVVVIISIFLLFFVIQMMQGGGSGGNKVMSFGKTRAKAVVDDKKKITFDNVASYEEEKSELKEIVEFLKSPRKFQEIGARIPKGVLLVGPPGTGKTYLARAVAGEAGVPFFSISGSDFVEMFVGVGASRVRDLFEQAKKNSPCIIFIDEIDAVGRRRGAGLGGGHDEREQTLNQLLVEMDGFGVNEGVIILAATNRPDILDPAILRPGRFDRRVEVGMPDVKGREEVLKVHAIGKKIAADVDFKTVAQTTSGFTPADLENLLNESAILAARDDKKEITPEDVRKAFVKVGMGTEKKSRVISAKERRKIAYHEAGHAILFEMLPDTDPVHIISIISTGRAGGYVMPLPTEDRMGLSKSYMEQQIAASMGGRAAEAIIFGDFTTGAASDIEQATTIARNMVTRYGMSEILGPIQFGNDSEEVFIGRDLAHARNYGEGVASTIDSEIKRIVNSAYDVAVRVIKENIDILNKTAEFLIEKERITGAEFRALFPEGVLPDKNRTEATATTVIAPEMPKPAEEEL